MRWGARNLVRLLLPDTCLINRSFSCLFIAGGHMRTLELAGRTVPVLGQGTWHMGEKGHLRSAEIAGLCLEGVDK
ncbi:hypothetical protein ALQ46_04759, partial [Pseudomonas savastanoi pv. phaseolicola]